MAGIERCPECKEMQYVVHRQWCAKCDFKGLQPGTPTYPVLPGSTTISGVVKKRVSAAAKQRAYRDRKRLKEGKEVRRCPTCQRMV